MRRGPGTFSTVYKAEDLLYDYYWNDWDPDSTDSQHWLSPPIKKNNDYASPSPHKRAKYVAVKKIYVTSSPSRIQNELELLNDLRGCKAVCPLITAFRHEDQVVAVLPFYRHQDFREFFRDMLPEDMQVYFRSLFRGLAAVHHLNIIHRDIKPTNFLFDYHRRRGVLVDFGLAEHEDLAGQCLCCETPARRKAKIETSYAARYAPIPGYSKNDTRNSQRANRAGTRGFRAPEVLFKCVEQTTKIDMWSAGVILLTILSRRFPFFNSADDIEALIEIATIWGQRRMRSAALLHGAVFDCTIPTIGERGYTLEKIIKWSTCKGRGEGSSDAGGEDPADDLSEGERRAIRFLERCLELDPRKRISAAEALKHEFLVEPIPTAERGDGEDEADEMDHL